jgi:aldose 1-epimerase
MVRATSGDQWTIRHGADEVTVVEVGGGLRSWTRDGVHVLAGYEADELCLAGRGQVLFPWPNRIRDGVWTRDGVTHRLALTEPKLGNASHGLVRWSAWQLSDRSESSASVTVELHPQPGWDWSLDLTVTYALGDDGLTTTTEVVNCGASPAPFGVGFHPYVSIGSTPVQGLELTVPASEYVTVDDRMLPTGTAPVEGSDYDFRTPREIGGTRLDTAFGDIDRDGDGRWRVSLSGMADLPPVTLWGDESYRWVQVFTGKAAAEGEHGVAIEPTTCPPDALNSGTDVLTIAPGERWTARWGLSVG